MLRRKVCFWLGFFCFSALFSCDLNLEPPYRVLLAGVFGEGAARPEIVTLESLKDPADLSGACCMISVGSKVLSKLLVTGTIYSRVEGGVAPKPSYTINSQKVIVPSNLKSLFYFAVYAQFELLERFWNNVLENTQTSRIFPSGVKIVIDPLKHDGSLTFEGPQAAFVSGGSSPIFLLASPSSLEAIPLGLSLRVLAHEYGHAIVDQFFHQESSSVWKRRTENEWNLEAFDEGIADFLSYVVTGSNDVLSPSFPNQGAVRKLPVGWTSKQVVDELTTSENLGPGYATFYAKGSVLASALYEITLKTQQDRREVGKQVIKSLEELARVSGRMDPILGRFRESADESFDLHYFIKPFIEQSPSEYRSLYCEVINKYFDDTVNSEEIAKVCGYNN